MRRVDGFLLEGREVAWAAVAMRLWADQLHRRDGALPAGVLELRDELAAFAARERVAAVVSVERESASPAAAVIVADSLTAQDAATVLQISPQAVRALCRSGVLLAIRTAAGHWQIDSGSAVALAARRKEA